MSTLQVTSLAVLRKLLNRSAGTVVFRPRENEGEPKESNWPEENRVEERSCTLSLCSPAVVFQREVALCLKSAPAATKWGTDLTYDDHRWLANGLENIDIITSRANKYNVRISHNFVKYNLLHRSRDMTVSVCPLILSVWDEKSSESKK